MYVSYKSNLLKGISVSLNSLFLEDTLLEDSGRYCSNDTFRVVTITAPEQLKIYYNNWYNINKFGIKSIYKATWNVYSQSLDRKYFGVKIGFNFVLSIVVVSLSFFFWAIKSEGDISDLAFTDLSLLSLFNPTSTSNLFLALTTVSFILTEASLARFDPLALSLSTRPIMLFLADLDFNRSLRKEIKGFHDYYQVTT